MGSDKFIKWKNDYTFESCEAHHVLGDALAHNQILLNASQLLYLKAIYHFDLVQPFKLLKLSINLIYITLNASTNLKANAKTIPPVILPEKTQLMSNRLHGGILFPTNSKYLNPFRQCNQSRVRHMDVPYTAFTFISIQALRKVQNARGAVGFQGAVGGIRPLVAVANAICINKVDEHRVAEIGF